MLTPELLSITKRKDKNAFSVTRKNQTSYVKRRRELSLIFYLGWKENDVRFITPSSLRRDFMFKVAIDGPSGAGKSTIAKTVAKKLGFVYIDTGAMYRTAALACIDRDVNIKANPEKAIEIVNNISIDIDYIDGEQRIFLDGCDVSDKIRTPQISMGASDVSAIGAVREKLVSMQRALAGTKNVIMDGRDIASSVLPDADVKIFLTASDKERANRRYKELIQKGEQVSYEDVLKDIQKRDTQDTTRAISPLKQVEDAVLVDTSDLTFDESVKAVLDLINSKREV